MKQIKLKIKPLSVNQCWLGKKVKSKDYREYEEKLISSLPNIQIGNPPYMIYLRWGVSSPLSDYDNPIKPFQDILQKRYGFNDKDIHFSIIEKKLVKKGEEYIVFKLKSLVSIKKRNETIRGIFS